MKKSVLIIAGLMLAACERRAPPAPAASVPTPEQAAGPTLPELRALGERVTAEIARIQPGTKVELTPDAQLRLETDAVMRLENLWSTCKRVPSTCDEEIAKWARVLLATLKPQGPPKMEDLRVVLNTEAILAAAGIPPADVVQRPWVGAIVQVLAEDTSDSINHLRKKRIAALPKELDPLFARGLANLRNACPQPIMGPRTVEIAGTHVNFTEFGDSYTAARMLLPELWSKIAARAGGRLWASAPARDIVIWTTSNGSADQAALRKETRVAIHNWSYPISPAILRWTGRGWTLEDPNTGP